MDLSAQPQQWTHALAHCGHKGEGLINIIELRRMKRHLVITLSILIGCHVCVSHHFFVATKCVRSFDSSFEHLQILLTWQLWHRESMHMSSQARAKWEWLKGWLGLNGISNQESHGTRAFHLYKSWCFNWHPKLIFACDQIYQNEKDCQMLLYYLKWIIYLK